MLLTFGGCCYIETSSLLVVKRIGALSWGIRVYYIIKQRLDRYLFIYIVYYRANAWGFIYFDTSLLCILVVVILRELSKRSILMREWVSLRHSFNTLVRFKAGFSTTCDYIATCFTDEVEIVANLRFFIII